MSEISPFAELLGQAIYHFEAMKPFLPTYGHLLVSALFPIYIGAHASLSRPSSAAEPPKKSQQDGYVSDSEDEDEEQGDDQKMEALEPSDALMFPLTAGLTLGGLYLVINYMGADMLNKVLGFYFSQMGMLFAVAFLKDGFTLLRSFVLPRRYHYAGKLWKAKRTDQFFTGTGPEDIRNSPLPGIFGAIPLPKSALAILWKCRSVGYQRAKLRINIHRIIKFETTVGVLDLISILVALPAVGYFTFVTKPWWLTNFLGFSFCYGTLQFMSPSTFVTGSLILSSLFFYDIYFVFFTPLMVTVATKLDVPIKLLFPRPADPGRPDAAALAMLGLGDIIIPGMMLGLALRFDLYLYYKRKGAQKAQLEGKEEEHTKPVYQSATGGWGDRFWAPSVARNQPELEPPYHDARSFPKTYFKASIVGYVLGMLATLIVMQIFAHAQPALLYLVPGVLISLWTTALVRGEIREMWEFSDAEEEEEDEPEDQKEKDEHTKNMGLFRRIFGGHEKTDKKGKKPSVSSETTAEEVSTEDKDNSKDKDVESKTDDAKGLDLFSVSLYIPQKSKPAPPKSPSSDAKSVDDENWSFVGKTERGDGPPPKRLRRSTRNAGAASD
ncbi:hypothetical protein FE257_011867 [Aspergillus nanangensis]|uniref:Signal peptide peptidase n=1 Tax=Aspergillus nanangensis TaxID=2582783 RepID=A0AAD4CGV3_ASPNN|nr:hypothetical protein FE257_011867 [Aspergillus nanangensis]